MSFRLKPMDEDPFLEQRPLAECTRGGFLWLRLWMGSVHGFQSQHSHRGIWICDSLHQVIGLQNEKAFQIHQDLKGSRQRHMNAHDLP